MATTDGNDTLLGCSRELASFSRGRRVIWFRRLSACAAKTGTSECFVDSLWPGDGR